MKTIYDLVIEAEFTEADMTSERITSYAWLIWSYWSALWSYGMKVGFSSMMN